MKLNVASRTMCFVITLFFVSSSHILEDGRYWGDYPVSMAYHLGQIFLNCKPNHFPPQLENEMFKVRARNSKKFMSMQDILFSQMKIGALNDNLLSGTGFFMLCKAVQWQVLSMCTKSALSDPHSIKSYHILCSTR